MCNLNINELIFVRITAKLNVNYYSKRIIFPKLKVLQINKFRG